MRLTPWRASNSNDPASAADQAKLHERLAKLTGGPAANDANGPAQPSATDAKPVETETPAPSTPTAAAPEPVVVAAPIPVTEPVAEPVLVGATIGQQAAGEAPAGFESS
jgi:hypothetical protein